MEKRSRWEPKPLLDENPWSLLRSVGLTKRGRWLFQAVLAIAAIVAWVATQRDPVEVALAWFISAWALKYINQRLSGLEAQLGVPRIDAQSSFQARLSLDSFALVLFALGLVILLFGWQAVRSVSFAQ